MKYLICTAVLIGVLFIPPVFAQTNNSYLRVAKIIVDSTKLADYKKALSEGIEAAVRLEPGVIALYAVYAKDDPTHITVFEIYESVRAYNLHIQTPHFKKYKLAVQDMVISLELTDVAPIALHSKGSQHLQ